ncbi:hypothetical protein PaG_01956 [Moesziomyces aphidis]|uniref:Uncharacterized protein n=1 Tax=Moesziomyces aphidis TaxID=84754 RepID=W3VQ12_MOEAP|nr:hypothetical protein PaG_01956 [Moesziomyces aphidis]
MSQFVGNTSLAFARTWHAVSAQDRVLGPLAVNIAKLLMGKHKPIYDQSKDLGDYVVVTNAKQVVVTGRKADQRVYRHHTMYPGGLKEIKYKEMMERKPEEIIRKAVSGMLPKNTLRDRRLERLKIFDGEQHPYAQNIIQRYPLGLTRSLSTSIPRHFWKRLFGSPERTPASAPRPTPEPIASASPSQLDTDTPAAAQTTKPVVKGKMLQRDAELLAKLLDRDGGSAAIPIINGSYAEGLGPETKKNMFRLI